jgi:hypothetical protein
MHRIPALRSVVCMLIKFLFLNHTPEQSQNSWSWPPRNQQRLLIYQLNYQTASLCLRKAVRRMGTSIKLHHTSILIISYHWMYFYCTITADERFSVLSMVLMLSHYQYSMTCLCYQSWAIIQVWEITIKTLSNNGCPDCNFFPGKYLA